MKIDRYSKAILTIIAAALVAMAAENLVRPSVAQTGVSKVAICELDGRNCAGTFPDWAPGHKAALIVTSK